jgi:hypothetical protein
LDILSAGGFKALNKDLLLKSAPNAFGVNCANEAEQRKNDCLKKK